MSGIQFATSQPLATLFGSDGGSTIIQYTSDGFCEYKADPYQLIACISDIDDYSFDVSFESRMRTRGVYIEATCTDKTTGLEISCLGNDFIDNFLFDITAELSIDPVTNEKGTRVPIKPY